MSPRGVVPRLPAELSYFTRALPSRNFLNARLFGFSWLARLSIAALWAWLFGFFVLDLWLFRCVRLPIVEPPNFQKLGNGQFCTHTKSEKSAHS